LELELRRSEGERRLYLLDGIGTLRLAGFFARTGAAEADGRRWSFGRRSLWRRAIRATDETDAEVGEFSPRRLRRGGTLRWDERELKLRPASKWRSRYALVSGEQELAIVEAKGWGKRPVTVTLPGPDAIDPGLVLFSVFVVRRLRDDEASGAVGAS
jgi:hypothetical protein